MMEGEEESLQLRIDVSLDQDKDENPNQDQEIVCSQSAENSDVDVVTLESDCPPLSSSSSSDGTVSGPEHVKIISPNTPPKVFKSARKRFTNLSFAERCYHIINYLCSSESVYPYFITHKWDRQNFRKRTESFRWHECRQKLFHFYKDQFGLGRYLLKMITCFMGIHTRV